ncbi:sensor histidine kinase [Altibacter sp. HG106]|uniref:sensor histidine kinase n=1 Tax=Altibacter sp. HG106 TaxID=3023937 RepID=UPI002350E009|nr:sensor histidine kinase [Altibacter sp. HG106]MDC7995462.1 two-component regulator propeller domain-containing protein [Altibacter sp. HG106]
MRLLPYFLMCLFPMIGQTPSYQFQHFGINEGLSQISLHDLEFDKTGHLWIATNNGIDRFDGLHFVNFQQQIDTTKNSLVFNEVSHIIQDQQENMWFATRQGLSKYDPRVQKFTNFEYKKNCDTCIVHPAISFLKEKDAYIYIGTVGGLSRIHKSTLEIVSWPYQEGMQNGPRKTAIRQLEFLEDGRLLIISQVGISIFNPTTETFKAITTEHGLPENKLQSIYRDSKNNYWIGCETKGLLKLTGTWDDPSFRHYPPDPETGPSHGFIYEITEDQHGVLWLATFNGVTLFNPQNEEFKYLYHNPNDKGSISSNQVFGIQRDVHNRMWLATISGLDVYDPYLNQFRYQTAIPGEKNSLSGNKTFSIFEDSKGYLWIGNYENGLTIIPPKNTDQDYFHITSGTGPDQLSGPQVLGIEEDHLGRIWLATFNGVNIVDWPDRTSDNYTISKLDLTSVPNNPHLTQYEYFVRRGTNRDMWIGTHGAGLIRVMDDGSLQQYSHQERPHGIAENSILSIGFDAEERIWVGTPALGFGVIEDYENARSFKRIPGNTVVAKHGVHGIFFKDEKEVLMTTGAGIFQIDEKEALFTSSTPDFKQHTEANGLSDNIVYTMVQTDVDEYWFSTGNGLTRWNTQSNVFTPYTKEFGHKLRDFNQGAAALTKDGTLYFGTTGLLSFTPSSIQENTVAPTIYFSDLRILNQPVPISEEQTGGFSLPSTLRYLEGFSLQPQDKIFSIAISAVNHTLPEETLYAYQLQGFDPDWIYTKDPVITRSNLDPGTYTLMAKAANNNQVWSEPVTLSIEILPPWWRTWWAYVLFVLLAVGSVYLLLKLRLQQERRLELARAQEREIFRKRSSRDFHDEAGTKITRISLITELAKLNNKDNPELQEHLLQIENNLHDLNNGMRDFIWTLDPTKDNAYDTLTRFTEFAGNFCEYAGIQFRSQHISDHLKEKELNMAERRHLLLILKEALNNSVKHGRPTIIDCIIDAKPGKLKVTLKDNGNGFDPLASNKGNGLTNMNERAQALGGALTINSVVNGGTQLVLTLETTRLSK